MHSYSEETVWHENRALLVLSAERECWMKGRIITYFHAEIQLSALPGLCWIVRSWLRKTTLFLMADEYTGAQLVLRAYTALITTRAFWFVHVTNDSMVEIIGPSLSLCCLPSHVSLRIFTNLLLFIQSFLFLSALLCLLSSYFFIYFVATSMIFHIQPALQSNISPFDSPIKLVKRPALRMQIDF